MHDIIKQNDWLKHLKTANKKIGNYFIFKMQKKLQII